MFNQIQLSNFAKFMGMDLQKAEITLNKQAKYLKISASFLLKSYKVVYQMQNEDKEEKAKSIKLFSKNILIMKYQNEITNLYCKNGFGYLKISKAMKINHNAKISKSAIENFIKQNKLVKGSFNG